MKKPLISDLRNAKKLYFISERGQYHHIPVSLAAKYLVPKKKININFKEVFQKVEKSLQEAIDADDFFQNMDKRYTKAGALLRGTRHREGLSQIEFAKRLGITQGDLSKMENGKRSIGKIIAKRIEKKFGVNYRYFLE